MIKVMMFGTREDEKEIAKDWANTHDVNLIMTDEPLTMETVKQLKGFDGVTIQQTAPVDDRLYEQLNKLGIKQIAQRSAGFDMYNLKLASDNQIVISTVPSYSPNSIAEYAVTSALQLVRKTDLIQQNVAANDFRWQSSIMGQSINSLEVAIIGTGRIGQITAQIFNGFGAKTVGYDPYSSQQAEQYLKRKDTLKDAVSNADIVSIHMPATEDTYHLFNSDLFNQFKDSAYLINTARGSIVDTTALINALDSGKLAGAALDTYERESDYFRKDFRDQDVTDPVLQELIKRRDVILTPHIAFYTDVAVKNMVESSLDATLSVIQMGTCDTRLN